MKGLGKVEPEKEFPYKDLTYRIIGAALEVYNVLGYGFLEKVYERALIEELTLRGLIVQTQYPVEVKYKGKRVGEYYIDIFVEEKMIVELKATEGIIPAYEAQVLNYLKATGVKVGLLVNPHTYLGVGVNFGPKRCEYKRLVY